MNSRELVDKIDELVAIASTTSSPDTQLAKIEEALMQACLFIKGLKRQLRKAIEESIERLPYGSEGQKLRLKDLAGTQTGLEVFESPQAFGDFLDSTVELLEAQGIMTRDRIEGMFNEFKKTYESIVDFKLDVDSLTKTVEQLENFYCRPPGGGPGSVLNPTGNGPAGGTKEARSSTLEVLALLAGIGSFILEVGKELWPLIFSAKEKKPGELPSSFEVLALASLNTIVSNIIAQFGLEATQRTRIRQPLTMSASD
jgi:hypothetical protein